jgi:hypothetical protein
MKKTSPEEILRSLQITNQIKFLLCLYWLKIEESFYFLRSPRANYHWLGNPRPRRYERLLIPAMYIGGILFFDGRDFATWAMYAGGVASIFVVLYSVYRLIPVKKYHWI